MTQKQGTQLNLIQQNVARWALGYVNGQYNYCILDTETTDLDGEVIDLAILDGKTGQVVLDQLIKPTVRITEAAARIHGISEEVVKDAPTFSEVWPQIFTALSGYKKIVTYNAAFDAARLQHTASMNGIALLLAHKDTRRVKWPQFEIQAPWECAMTMYAQFWGEKGYYNSYRWQRLNVACKQQGIEHSNWHRALGDCLATLKLMRVLAAKWQPEAAAGSEVTS
jgi:DNA polymerase III epsilon subunit-like protein